MEEMNKSGTHNQHNQFWHLPIQPNSTQMSRSAAGGGGEQSLLAPSVVITRGSDCTFIMSLLFSAASCWDSSNCPYVRTDSITHSSKVEIRAVWPSAARATACRNTKNILSPVLGVTQRNWKTSCRMQVRLWSDRLWGMCALSPGPLPSRNDCCVGDWGFWVTDGGWATSAIVNSSRRGNPSHIYCTKSVKDARRVRRNMTRTLSKTGTQSRTSLCFHKIVHPSIHPHTQTFIEESPFNLMRL